MNQPTGNAGEEVARLRQMAAELDAWCEPDFLTLTGYTPATLEQYRKRGVVDYIRVGRHYIYPKAPAIERFKAGSKAQRRVPARELL